MQDVADQLASIEAQFISMDLEFPAPLQFGKVCRVKASGDKGTKKSGWYVCHEFRLDNGDIVITGKIGNWKTCPEGVVINVDWKGFSDSELAKMKEQAEKQKQDAIKAKLKLQRETIKKANSIWDKLPTEGSSPYLKRKKVPAFGLKFSRGSVAVPIYNIDGDLVNLQFTDKDGTKRFLTGGQVEGCFHKFGKMTDKKVIVVAEGYATGASIHLATKLPIVVAFNAGNLKPVVVAIKKKYPDYLIVIAADDDRNTKGNPGVKKATEAAQAVGAKFVIPQFSSAA